MQVVGKTDVGRKRQNNQDAFFVRKVNDTCAFALLCDGMGGHSGGELASSVALYQLERYFNNICSDNLASKPLHVLMKSAVEKANRAVYAESLKKEDLRGMGTTVVAALRVDDKLHILHVGDSRAYLYHADGSLKRLTKDHSYVQEMLDRGEITQEQAVNNPYKHLITRALGISADVQPDINTFVLQPGDRVLLCSDGLYNMVSTRDTEKIIKDTDTAETLCDRLIASANEAGGNDNITVCVMTID